MIRNNIFEIKDNFSNTAKIPSICIKESKLGFVPKVTIAIPTYNRPHLLKEAIDSAINQIDYDDYDIVVVDNNSERNCATEKLIESYDDPRLSYYKNSENIGMVNNLNRIYMISKSDYVVELHDDDFLYPDYLAVIMEFIKSNNEKYHAIYPDMNIYNMIGSSTVPQRSVNRKTYKLDLKVKDFLWGNISGSSGHIFKREPFIELGGYDCGFYPADDLEFNVKLTHFSNTCILIGYPLCIYRISQNTSIETETLLGWAVKGKIINENILGISKNRLANFVWARCNNANTFKLLDSNKKLYSNKEIDVKRELESLGFKQRQIDFLIYRGMLTLRILYDRVRRKRVKLVCTNVKL
jgi:glycosyltransferase involved in cell wall biosynthesis